MTTRNEIVAEARTWIGTPFAPAGVHKGKGVNCLGFIAAVARDCGLRDFWRVYEPFQGLARPETRLSLRVGMTRHLEKIPHQRAREGDLLLFETGGTGPNHVAMITEIDPIYVVHACSNKRRVYEYRLPLTPHCGFHIPGVV